MALLEVEDLKVYYPVKNGLFSRKRYLKAVDGVSFSLDEGETLSLVGESGCGKSTLGKALVQLEKPFSGGHRQHPHRRKRFEFTPRQGPAGSPSGFSDDLSGSLWFSQSPFEYFFHAR